MNIFQQSIHRDELCSTAYAIMRQKVPNRSLQGESAGLIRTDSWGKGNDTAGPQPTEFSVGPRIVS